MTTSTVAVRGPEIYHEQTVEVVPKIVAEPVERFMGPISSALQPEADGQWVRYEDFESAELAFAAERIGRDEAEAQRDSLRAKVEAEVVRYREREANYEAWAAVEYQDEDDRQLSRRLAAEMRYVEERLSALLEETGS